jgi:hypothetical protein
LFWETQVARAHATLTLLGLVNADGAANFMSLVAFGMLFGDSVLQVLDLGLKGQNVGILWFTCSIFA